MKDFLKGLGKAVIIVAESYAEVEHKKAVDAAERASIGQLTLPRGELENLRGSTILRKSGDLRYIERSSYFGSDWHLFGASFRAFAGKNVGDFEITDTSGLREGAVLRCRYKSGQTWRSGYVTIHVSNY